MSAALPLRDVHLPPEPALWPLAPGWWLVIAAALLLIAVPLAFWLRRTRRRRRWRDEAEQAWRAAGDDPARVAVLVGLLRRAARQREPGSEQLQGEAWVNWLDPADALDPAQRQLLHDGSYRRDVDGAALARLRPWAVDTFVRLRDGSRR